MRGEYKVIGGKLVVAEVEVAAQRLSHVSISGDFFLQPDEALSDINSALLHQPVDASVAQLTAVIESALGEEVVMFGFSAQAVAIAVRRALGFASTWHDHRFTVLPPKTLPGAMHVALDEVLLTEAAEGRRSPTLRFWDWEDSLVVIGAFQSVKNEIDQEGARQHNINVVRRVTGGGAMFMEPGNCITYSLVVPESLVEGMSFEQSYAFLDGWVLGALAEVGIEARYEPLNDITSPQGKIGGAAQKRSRGMVLHHVTMAYDINAERMLDVLRIGREKMSDKGTKSASKRVDPMRSQTGMAQAEIVEAFIQYFLANYDAELGDYTDDELAQAKALMNRKFLQEDWVYKVP